MVWMAYRFSCLNGEAVKLGTPFNNNQIASITLGWNYGGVTGDSLVVTDASGKRLVFLMDAAVSP